MISVQNVSKKFGDITAVESISFDIMPGEVVGFLGPNGAGKSTTMRMIAGFIPPTHGMIKIDGHDIILSPIAAKQKIGYLGTNRLYQPAMMMHAHAILLQK